MASQTRSCIYTLNKDAVTFSVTDHGYDKTNGIQDHGSCPLTQFMFRVPHSDDLQIDEKLMEMFSASINPLNADQNPQDIGSSYLPLNLMSF